MVSQYRSNKSTCGQMSQPVGYGKSYYGVRYVVCQVSQYVGQVSQNVGILRISDVGLVSEPMGYIIKVNQSVGSLLCRVRSDQSICRSNKPFKRSGRSIYG